MRTKARRGSGARLAHLVQSTWALHPETLARVIEWGRGGFTGAPEEIVGQAEPEATLQTAGSIAVIQVYGVIEHHSDLWMELFGGTSVDGIRDDLADALGNPKVSAVVLDVDSPGGTVAGVTELAAEIRGARGQGKPIVAVANGYAASAAYWIASQADEFSASPSAMVGSIGVYAVHQDLSGYLAELGIKTTLVSAGPHKTDGNEFEPLSDEARKDLQSRVNASYRSFVDDVAAGRGVSAATVKADFGEGRLVTARDAKAVGMVDRLETLGEAILRLSKPAGRRSAGAAATAGDLGPEAAADADPADDADEAPATFTDRVAALADEAIAVAEAAQHRARSRAAEGRPAFATGTERALRVSRDALTALLEPGAPADEAPDPTQPGEPAAAADPQAPASEPDPPPAKPALVAPLLAAAAVTQFQDRESWLRYLEENAS